MIILPRWIEVNIALNKTTANADGEGLRYNLKPFLDVHITAYLLLVDILKIRTKRATLILIMSATFLQKTLFAKFFIVLLNSFLIAILGKTNCTMLKGTVTTKALKTVFLSIVIRNIAFDIIEKTVGIKYDILRKFIAVENHCKTQKRNILKYNKNTRIDIAIIKRYKFSWQENENLRRDSLNRIWLCNAMKQKDCAQENGKLEISNGFF